MVPGIGIFGLDREGKLRPPEAVARGSGRRVRLSAAAMQVYRDLTILTNQVCYPPAGGDLGTLEQEASVGQYEPLDQRSDRRDLD